MGRSVDAASLHALLPAHPVVAPLMSWRSLNTLKGGFVDALAALVDVRDGRLHTTYNQAATSTGRWGWRLSGWQVGVEVVRLAGGGGGCPAGRWGWRLSGWQGSSLQGWSGDSAPIGAGLGSVPVWKCACMSSMQADGCLSAGMMHCCLQQVLVCGHADWNNNPARSLIMISLKRLVQSRTT